MDKTTKEIHDDRVEVYNVLLGAQDKFIDKKTGTYAEKYIEYRACPVCSENSEKEIFIKKLGRYVQCEKCKMVYLNPVLTDKALEDHYKTNNDLQASMVESDLEFYNSIYSKGLKLAKDKGSLVDGGNILDIGCSSGVFLDLANRDGFNTYGVELNLKEAEYASKKGHQVSTALIQNTSFDTKFDLVTLWDVFEHIKDGHSFLKVIRELLTDNGVIFMQVPSSDALAAKILQEKCNMFDGIEHVNVYNYASLEKLLDLAGFELLGIQTVIAEIGVINNFMNYDNPYTGGTNNRQFIPKLITEEKVHETLQGYKFQFVIKPK